MRVSDPFGTWLCKSDFYPFSLLQKIQSPIHVRLFVQMVVYF